MVRRLRFFANRRALPDKRTLARLTFDAFIHTLTFVIGP